MRGKGAAAVLVLCACAGVARREAPPEPAVLVDGLELEEEELRTLLTLSPLPPVPDDPTNAHDTDERAARLGERIFFDERFSGAGDVSCSTCHRPEQAFSDGLALPELRGERLTRHTPSLWNVAYNRWYFWDGRADSLWAQALQPLEDEREHGGTRLQYVHLLAEHDDLRASYEAAFGALPDVSDAARFPRAGRPVPRDPAHPHRVAWSGMAEADRAAVDRVFVHLGKALAAYERGLVARSSPFDTFVRGVRERDAAAQAVLDEPARRGLALFLGRGRCATCHAGPNLTDGEFHNTFVPASEAVPVPDMGRSVGIAKLRSDPFNGLGPHADGGAEGARDKIAYLSLTPHNTGEVKTPSLRNVATTAPYMHQGQLATLEDVVRHYSTVRPPQGGHLRERILRPLELTAGEVADLVAFLRALTAPGATGGDAPGEPTHARAESPRHPGAGAEGG